MANYHARFSQEGRVQDFCCEEFNRPFKWWAKRALKKYEKKRRVTSDDGLQPGKCPAGIPRCR
jgi:hypothetical protein